MIISVQLISQFQGVIVDANSEEPIPFVSIQIKNTSRGTTSDENGFFSFESVPDGAYIVFSHINYQPNVYVARNIETDTIVVQLFVNQNVIQGIDIIAKRESVPITDNEKYDIKDFLVWGKEIIVLERHGTFKSSYLTRYTLDMQLIHRKPLTEIKFAESIFKACNDRIYVVGIYKVQLLKFSSVSTEVDSEYGIDFYNGFIAPCELKLDDIIYYQTKVYNDLVSRFKRYDANADSIQLITEIFDEKLLDGYFRDLRKMNYGKNVSTIQSTKSASVKQGRDAQREAEFLSNVVYVPRFNNYIFYSNNEVVIMDNVNGAIKNVSGTEIKTKINYDFSKKTEWKNTIIQDEITSQIFTFFESKEGIEIYRIDSASGNLDYVGFADIPDDKLNDVQIHNNLLYFTKRKSYENVNDILMRLPLKRH